MGFSVTLYTNALEPKSLSAYVRQAQVASSTEGSYVGNYGPVLFVRVPITWRPRALSKWVISRVLSTLNGVTLIITLLITDLLSPRGLQVEPFFIRARRLLLGS